MTAQAHKTTGAIAIGAALWFWSGDAVARCGFTHLTCSALGIGVAWAAATSPASQRWCAIVCGSALGGHAVVGFADSCFAQEHIGNIPAIGISGTRTTDAGDACEAAAVVVRGAITRAACVVRNTQAGLADLPCCALAIAGAWNAETACQVAHAAVGIAV